MQQLTVEITIPLLLIPILLAAYTRLRLKVLKRYNSPLLGKIEVIQKYNGEKVLTTNSYPQGISVEQPSTKQSYWYKVAEQAAFFCGKKSAKEVLMLGLGANTISNLIAQLNPAIHQTIVEIDPLVIQACRQYFQLNELPHKTIIQADVFQLAKKRKPFPRQFDVIIVDIFTGNPPYHSIASNQPKFIEEILVWLKKDGMIIFNRPAHTEQVRQDGRELKKYLNILFQSTEVFDIQDPRGFRNYVITAKEKLT